MNNEIEKPKVQADNNSIAIGEINISGTVTGNIHIGHTILQAADARLCHDLSILLKNVETTWIKGVLEKSVHEAALFELGMEIRVEAVDNPWRMVIEKPDQSQEVIPQGRKIKDIFDEANRLLLILGEPGSGKTTTLLQLAHELIADVDEAFTQPVPVILNLSTWTDKQQPLDEWLIAELNSKYRLPKKDGKRWLSDHRILPLLDGLDEVRAENRTACVEKINQLVTDYGLQGTVVCSRIKDYTDLNVRLSFYRAIYIQPLTVQQVNEYLERAGNKLASLRVTLQSDESLRSMAQSPLILNVMSLAYQNISAEDLSNPALTTDKARRKQLFDAYVARMFNRKVGRGPYNDEQTKQRLSWLARNMQKQNQEIFLIENLQPSWLSTRAWQWIYFFNSRLLSVIILACGLTAYGLIWLIIATIAGLSLGCIDVIRSELLRKSGWIGKSNTFLWLVINVVLVWLIVGIIVGLTTDWVNGLFVGLIIGLIFGLRGNRQNLANDIQTIEALRWSGSKALKGGLIGVFGGLIYGIYTAIYFQLISLDIFLEYGKSYALMFGPIGVILNGLRREIIEAKSSPNEGIWLSIRNAIFGGLIIAMSFELVLLGSGETLLARLQFGLIVGLVGALWFGGFDVIQHYILRLILVIQGHTPTNYARFLDYAVDHIFLQKVGGGYRFIHRLLLEHFVEMYEPIKKI